MAQHHFISYSSADGEAFALKLADALAAGPPVFPVWIDSRDLKAGIDWDVQIPTAIRDCRALLFVMTPDSVTDESTCKAEWAKALSYKKPIIPLRFSPDADLPFRLSSRQYISFTESFEPGLARLRNHLAWMDSPDGVLQQLRERLADARHELPRAEPERRLRIEVDIQELEVEIAAQAQVAASPERAAAATEQRIASGVERERQPAEPAPVKSVKFINPPPMTAPIWFQDRYVETKLIGDFLADDSRRLMTVVGRGGIGKTAMVCRLLKALEAGRLPDDLGDMPVDGIVYLSPVGRHQISFPNLYADLGKLLPREVAERLEALARDPQQGPRALMLALLEEFPRGRVVALLDNLESVLDPATDTIADAELGEALRTVLEAPHHSVKLILTTRAAPRDLQLVQSARQQPLPLDEGLTSPEAENLLRALDTDGTLGLKNASDEHLGRARIQTRGFPKALEAIVTILSADRGTTLEEILDQAGGLLPELVVEVLVGEAFDRLDPTAQRVMQALAVYQAPVSAVAVDFLLQPYDPAVNSGPILSRLVSRQLARRDAGQYHLHQVDRDYAFGSLPTDDHSDKLSDDVPPFTQRILLDRAADYFAKVRTPRDTWKSLDDLKPQFAEFELRCQADDFDTAGSVLADIGFEYLMLWGHYRLLARQVNRIVDQIHDPFLRSIQLSNLGSCYDSLGEYRSAIDFHEQALAIARDIGNRAAEGANLGNLGLCYDSLGEYRRAIDCHEQALAIARNIGDRRGEGADLGNLGNCYYSLGEYRRAIDLQEQALAIARDIGDRSGEGARLGSLGNCYSSLGEYRRAIDYLEQALAIAHDIGDRHGEEVRLGNLGNCYYSLGEYRRAIEFQLQALAIDRDIGDRSGEGADLGSLGNCYFSLGEYRRAINFHEQALTIARDIGDAYNLANFLNYLARVSLAAKNTSGAKPLVAEAIALSDATSAIEPNSESRLLMARLLLATGDPGAALRNAQEARAIGYPPRAAEACLLEGIALLFLERGADARLALDDALAASDELLGKCSENVAALYAKGLVLSALVLARYVGLAEQAVAAFRAAQAVTDAAGVVAEALRLFDVIAARDAAGVLSPVRAALAGEG